MLELRLIAGGLVIAEEVKGALKKIGNWKALGFDGLPAGFFKACRDPLATIIATLATASFEIGY